MTTSKTPTINEIENFIINNKNLSIIESHVNKFNPIRVMKMERMEIRHSAILGWLLNPRENHGLDDNFLKRFLSEALKNTNLFDKKVSALDVHSKNLASANVYVEWNNIDIFVEYPTDKWIFIIENKIDSVQHSNQLERYKKFIERHFKGYKYIGVFLTLSNELPEDDSYSTIRYQDLIGLIDMCLHERKDSLSSKVFNFIKYYEEIISNELCEMNDETRELEDIAKRLYQEHRKAIDYIVEHGASTEFQFALESLFNNKKLDYGNSFEINSMVYNYFAQSKSLFSFLPESWINALGVLNRDTNSKLNKDDYLWKGCENWWHGYPIICWVELKLSTDKKYSKDFIKLVAEIGPLSDFNQRNSLIQCIQDCDNSKKVSFNKNAIREGAKFSRFLKGFTKPINDIQNYEEIKLGIEALLKEFGKDIVKPVSEQLNNFMKK